ncbi:MAG: hypothetical protein ACOY15_06700 [Pseudomonadota bacterium]
MRASNELYAFCAGMSRNSDRNVSTFQGWIAGGLSLVDKEHLLVFRNYLDELLSGRYSNSQLEEIYNSTDPEIAISGSEAARFLFEVVRDTIDGKPVHF